MSNGHVTKPNPSAFDDMHLVRKLFWVVVGAFLVLFWTTVLFGML
ncbi:hypothetical protein [Halorussus lipolyticus]|nr:hypothetical protein [Halorussus sp. DT80]